MKKVKEKINQEEGEKSEKRKLPILKFDHVSKIYKGDFVALEDIDLKLKKANLFH